MDADFSELMELARDLESLPENAGPFIRKAVEVSARNVKDEAAKQVRARKYFKGGARSIDYELKGFQGFGSTVLDAEIGYNKGKRGGNLGNLIEFGAPNAPRMMHLRSKGGWKTVPVPGGGRRPLPPGGELQSALRKTAEDFESGIDKAVADALREAGL